jgi:hypothetical protein
MPTLRIPACPPTLDSPSACPHSHRADDDLLEGIHLPCHAVPQSSLRGAWVVPSFWHDGGPIFVASDIERFLTGDFQGYLAWSGRADPQRIPSGVDHLVGHGTESDS